MPDHQHRDPSLHREASAPTASTRPGEGIIVAVQGEPGSNSAHAVGEMLPYARLLPCTTFQDAFSAVRDGAAHQALIPVENSSAGRVADPHQLLPDSGLHIIGEHFLPIRFDLVGLPGTNLDEVTAVRSHVHAFGQCRRLLDQYRWQHLVSADTAGAAREVAAARDPRIVALAPPGAAALHGLEVLRADVQDNDHNATRFLLLAPEPLRNPSRPAVTTIVYRVRNVPAALYKTLGGFATNGVNMTKLESYQLEGTFHATQFYVDIQGHREDLPVRRALEELAFFVSEMTVLGCYPESPQRRALTRQDSDGADEEPPTEQVTW